MQPDLKTERRKRTIPAATDRRKHEGADGKPDPFGTSPADDEPTAFMKAMERYKRQNRRPFPTWSEVLEVLRSLGYRQVAPLSEMPLGDRRQQDLPVTNDRRHHTNGTANGDGVDTNGFVSMG